MRRRHGQSKKVWPNRLKKITASRSSSSLQSVGFTVAFLAAGLLFLPGGLCSAEARTTLSEAGDTLVGIPRVVDGDTLVVSSYWNLNFHPMHVGILPNGCIAIQQMDSWTSPAVLNSARRYAMVQITSQELCSPEVLWLMP